MCPSCCQDVDKERIPHNVLNAKRDKEEAEIIAQAGRLKAVTIATNMAGRARIFCLAATPNIWQGKKWSKKLQRRAINIANAYNALEDEEHIKARQRFNELKQNLRSTPTRKRGSKKLGGLRVIGTERHESRRIDNQLRGRAGRQETKAVRVFICLLKTN